MQRVRSDELTRVLGRRQAERFQLPISDLPAEVLWRGDQEGTRFAVAGHDVASIYRLLIHYSSTDALNHIIAMEGLDPGCWLTPTPYAACMAPYDLGLRTPRNVCLLVDVSSIPKLWGPGTSAPSPHSGLWKGGGIEFYCPTRIEMDIVRQVIELAPCGDTHL